MSPIVETSSIVGWGVDADPQNDPTFPMRDRTQEVDRQMTWARPSQQPESVEVLMSVEHVRRPAVFGTSTPPSGLSGLVRRLAFRFSESQWAHWLLLIAADRINVVEGNLHDLTRGHVPNIPGEMGVGAEIAFNKRRLITRVAVTAAFAAGVVIAVRAMRR